MKTKFQMHLDESAIPSQSPYLADGCGDPIFLEESWLLGVHAAADNLQSRRQQKVDRDLAFRDVDSSLGALRFTEVPQGASDSALMERAASIVDRFDVGSPQSWTPQDWTPQDRIAQSWIPQGWRPSYMPHFNGLEQPELCAESSDCTMTPQRARLLLEVVPASTREQVRSAYRRMVGQWHPDRLGFTTPAVREHATRHMAALNEAYRLLCSAEFKEAA